MTTLYTPLIVSPLPDGKNWRLVEEFEYCGHHIPHGFVTDFASIPRILEPLLAPWSKISKSSCLHDWLYRSKPCTRAEADWIFYQASRLAWQHHRTGKYVAWIEFMSVRLFGWLAWNNKRRA